MKKFFFALPLLSIAFLFAFCHKTSVQEEASFVKNDMAAAGRGICDVFISADNVSSVLEICGDIPPAQMTQKCNTCTSTATSGGATFQGFINLNSLTTPAVFSIRNPGPINTWVTLSSGNVLGPVLVPANGGCVTFTIDDNCNIQ